MPPLRRPEVLREIELPRRRGQVAAETDVLVVGGGPAGIGAAVGAATAGARVVLAEHQGFLGGNATAALVNPLASYHCSELAPTQPGTPSLYPTDTYACKQVIKGVVEDFVQRLVRAGGAIRPTENTGYVVPFDTEVFKLVAQQILDDAGVQLLLHSFASGVTGEGAPDGVVFETKSGPVVIRAKVIVDCSGDADVAAAAGARYDIGREDDGFTQPMTLIFAMTNFERELFVRYVEENPGQWFGVYGLWDLVMEAVQSGEYEPPREDILMFGTPRSREVTLNSTRVTKVSGVDVWDLSYAEFCSRKQLAMVADFLRKHVPGFADAYVGKSGIIGVRETRRVKGEYTLTGEDVLEARSHEDVIACNAYPVDIHNPTGRGTTLRRVPPGQAYDIPLRCLLPVGVDNLLVAGRCLSSTHEALSSVRVMPSCMATGQAAGVCAAQAAQYGAQPRDVPYAQVREELLAQGAYLGDAVHAGAAPAAASRGVADEGSR